MNLERLHEGFVAWLDRLATIEIGDDVVAFCLNLSEGRKGFHADLVGAAEYDPDDSDWACDADSLLGEKFFDLPHAVVGKKWDRVELLCEGWLRDYLERTPRSPLRAARAVALGFVDGDLVTVWMDGAFRPREESDEEE